jgi:acid phosphatase type 7
MSGNCAEAATAAPNLGGHMRARMCIALLATTTFLLLAAPFARAADPLIAAAGDISCQALPETDEWCQQQATSDLLVGRPLSALLVLGDSQYEDGSLPYFWQFYDPTWGRFLDITHPAVGNHEYKTQDAQGYFQYFGARAGDPRTGYYSFDVGDWHLIALNSNCNKVGGCGHGTPQEQWLKSDLAANRRSCTLAYWHQPHFSSGFIGDDDGGANPTGAFWEDLYYAGADVVLGGHDHHYERFGLQDMDGAPDWAYGIPEFVVGTGGKSHSAMRVLSFNSQVRDNTAFGVLEMTLHPHSYDWRFVPAQGRTFTDSGTERCHGAPNDPLIRLSRPGRKLSRAGSLRVFARCSATCKARARVTVTIGRRKIRSRRFRRTFFPQVRKSFRVKFSKRGFRAIERAFEQHRRLRAELTARASAPNDNSGSVRLRIRLRR